MCLERRLLRVEESDIEQKSNHPLPFIHLRTQYLFPYSGNRSSPFHYLLRLSINTMTIPHSILPAAFVQDLNTIPRAINSGQDIAVICPSPDTLAATRRSTPQNYPSQLVSGDRFGRQKRSALSLFQLRVSVAQGGACFKHQCGLGEYSLG